jgi:cysteine synthase A
MALNPNPILDSLALDGGIRIVRMEPLHGTRVVVRSRPPSSPGRANRRTSMDDALARRFLGLRCLVGNTPLLAIDCTFHGRRRTVYAKAEHLNMTGSIKDRMALHVLERAYERGALGPGDPILEATSGNTGISVAALGSALGHPVTIFMPDWMSRERIDLIRSLGARVRLVAREEGGFLGCIRRAEAEAAACDRAFLPRQFSNADNVEAHARTTGPEIWWQLRFRGLQPDAFVAGVGTGGTVMGVGRFLREHRPEARIHPLEPSNSPTLSTGHRIGKHRIEGISDEFVPPIVDLSSLDEVISVDDGDAIVMAQRLARELGLAVGISSGANLLGALQVLEGLGGEAVVATVFPDDNKKYLSTDLLRDEPVRSDHGAPHVELRGFRAFKRVCHTCCDPLECTEPLPADLVASAEALPPCPRRMV